MSSCMRFSCPSVASAPVAANSTRPGAARGGKGPLDGPGWPLNKLLPGVGFLAAAAGTLGVLVMPGGEGGEGGVTLPRGDGGEGVGDGTPVPDGRWPEGRWPDADAPCCAVLQCCALPRCC